MSKSQILLDLGSKIDSIEILIWWSSIKRADIRSFLRLIWSVLRYTRDMYSLEVLMWGSIDGCNTYLAPSHPVWVVFNSRLLVSMRLQNIFFCQILRVTSCHLLVHNCTLHHSTLFYVPRQKTEPRKVFEFIRWTFQISVRSGGHGYTCTQLKEDSILIDMRGEWHNPVHKINVYHVLWKVCERSDWWKPTSHQQDLRQFWRPVELGGRYLCTSYQCF